MSRTTPPLPQYLADKSYGKVCLTLSSPAKKVNLQEEEVYNFPTIDGSVITRNAGAKAIDSGVGIFIGDYFVGMSDNSHSISNLPLVHY